MQTDLNFYLYSFQLAKCSHLLPLRHSWLACTASHKAQPRHTAHAITTHCEYHLWAGCSKAHRR